MNKANAWKLALLLLIVGGTAYFGLRQRPARPLAIGDRALDFSVPALPSGSLDLKSYRGQVVLLNFWATWCAPCRVEIPWFVELEKEYGAQGLVVIGVDMDEGGAAAIEPFVRKEGMDYPVLVDDGRASAAYGATEVLPTTYYIGRDGRVVACVRGLASKGEVERNIEEILARP